MTGGKSIRHFRVHTQMSINPKIPVCYLENRNLASLRDALLPELMSGWICVLEVREVVQQATDILLPEVEDG